MLYNNKYRIESARLKGWDYSTPGYYHVTICTGNRHHFFGAVVDAEMVLSESGKIAEQFWREISNQFSFVCLDEYIIMPNHVHGIIRIMEHAASYCDDPRIRRDAINRVSTDTAATKNGGITKSHNPMNNPFSLSTVIRWYKGRTTFEIRRDAINRVSTYFISARNRVSNQFKWQSRFYDSIIRSSTDLNNVRAYISANPTNWKNDRLYDAVLP